MQNSPTRAEIYQTFSSITKTDSLQEQENKNDPGNPFFYVNWMDVLAVARKSFPNIHWEHYVYEDGGEAYFFPDKTAEVKVTILIDDVHHTTTLPVSTLGQDPAVNPNAALINTSKKRALCKALGEMGLFWQLWSDDERDEFVKRSQKKKESGLKVVNIKEPANDEIAKKEEPEKEKADLDPDVLIQEAYNRLYDDELKALRSKKTFHETLEKVCNNLRNKFGKGFHESWKARVIRSSYHRKKWEVPREGQSNVG